MRKCIQLIRTYTHTAGTNVLNVLIHIHVNVCTQRLAHADIIVHDGVHAHATCIHIHTHIHIYTHAYAYLLTHACLHIYTSTCTPYTHTDKGMNCIFRTKEEEVSGVGLHWRVLQCVAMRMLQCVAVCVSV